MDYSTEILLAHIILKERYCHKNCKECKFSTTRPEEKKLVCLLAELGDTWHIPRYNTDKVLKSASCYIKGNCNGFEKESCEESKCWLYSYDLESCLADLIVENNDEEDKIVFHL